MNLNIIKNMLGPRVGLAGLLVKKYSPEVFLVGGLVAGASSAVMLAKAHKKSDDVLGGILEEAKQMREAFEENNFYFDAIASDETAEYPEDAHYYTKAEQRQLLLPVYLEFVKEAAILYGPAILMGFGAIFMIVRGHGIMQNRNKAIMSGFMLVQQAFEKYRERVREELGEEGDNRFLYGLEKRNLTEITVGKDGKKHREKRTKDVLPEKLDPSMYQRVFDRTNQNFRESPEMNAFWLGVAQQTMQDTLDRDGFVFLNDVYELLGFDKTPEGQVVGWSLAAPGDDFIYFGLDEHNRTRPDGSILLDFNVNGPVFEYIGLSNVFKKNFGKP